MHNLLLKQLETLPDHGLSIDLDAAQLDDAKYKIIRAAITVFARDGFEGASLRDIASLAGSTHGLIRHYYGNKEGVWRTVVSYVAALYVHAYAAVLPTLQSLPEDSPEDPHLLLKDCMGTFIDVSARYPDLICLLMHEGSSTGARLDHLLKVLEPLTTMFSNLFDKVREQGYMTSFMSYGNFLVTFVGAAGMPLGLRGFSSHYLGGDILSEPQLTNHKQRVLSLFFSQA